MGFVEDLTEWLTSCACDNQLQPSPQAPGLETNHPLSDEFSETSNPCCAQTETKKKSITLPFSKHESSRLCLAAALNIAKAFEALPYPPPEANPLSQHPSSLSSSTTTATPRTLPSFACCAMQAAYALLMVCNQAWAMQTGAMPATHHPRKLLAQCEQGLYSLLSTLDNYALAFEAIRGMRGMRLCFLPFRGLPRRSLTSFAYRSGPGVHRRVCESFRGRCMNFLSRGLDWANDEPWRFYANCRRTAPTVCLFMVWSGPINRTAMQ